MTIYTLQQFHDIKQLESYKTYQLPTEVVSILKELETEIIKLQPNETINHVRRNPREMVYGQQIDNSVYGNDMKSRKMEYDRKKFHHGGRNGIKHTANLQANDENWNAGKNIKITPKLVSENTDKTIIEIRTALNKLSTKNYDSQRDVIIQNINSVLTSTIEDNNQDAVLKIAQLIFDIASSNKFMSELYAKLYKELVDQFDVFNSPISNLFENYKTSLSNIIYVNPNEDYNGYCTYTKSNDSRKSLTTFIVNLMKHKVLREELILDMVFYMIDVVYRYAAEADRTNEVEEITENLFIMISQGDKTLSELETWTENVIPKIHELSKLRKTEGAKYPSMTNRATFKYMDILDNLA